MQIILGFSVLLAVLSGSVLAQNESIKVGDKTRTFITYKPSGLTGNPPLVISIHGLGGSGSFQRQMYPMDRIADEEKFIVVYPDGVDKSEGAAGWDIKNSSDIEFLSDLIDTMITRNSVDSNRVFATGFSMGGMMSYKLACAVSDKIAAIGPASGYPWDKLNPENCEPIRPVPICHVHGMTDNVVAYSGLQKYIDRWVTFNGCAEGPAVTTPTSRYKKIHYKGCEGTSEIVEYLFEGMGHEYPKANTHGFSPSDTIWEFFKAHPKEVKVEVTGASINTASGVTSVAVFGSRDGIRVRCSQVLDRVRIFDARGRIVAAVLPGGGVRSVLVQINGVARRVYLVDIMTLEGVRSIRPVIR